MLNATFNKRERSRLPLLFLTLLILCLPPLPAAARTEGAVQKKITAQGTVVDERKEPLIGVNVVVKGTAVGTVTDTDGRFALETPPDATLVFTYVGMNPAEVAVKNNRPFTVTLQSNDVLLQDVVVIGYGKQSKAALTSSITKVGANDLAVSPSGNPMAMLQGKVPGLEIRVNSGQPGADPQLILRGGTTTSPESDAPMVVIDGSVRTLKDVNYRDIETIQVLKDAASTAIYGSKASNGIVIITTKQGAAGKNRISFGYGLTVSRQPGRFPISGAREYLTATRTAALHATNPAKYLEGTFAMSTANGRDALNTTAFLDDYIGKYGQDYVEDLLYNQGWEIMEDPAAPGKMLLFKDTDFQDNLFRTALGHDFNFDLSGGTDKATYYMSFGYLDQEGIVVGSGYDRWSMTLNASYRVLPSLTARGSVNYSMRTSKGVNENNALARASLMPPTVRQYYEDGRPAPGELTNTFRTRLHEVYYQERENQVSRINLAGELDWEIAGGLHFKPMFSFHNYEGKDHNFERENEVIKNRPASENHNMDLHYQFDAILTYDKSFRRHNLGAMGGFNYIYESTYRFSGSGYDGTSDYVETLNGTAPESQKTTSTLGKKRMSSFFGRINYNYDMKYLFSASVRYDGSSHFAENHKYAAFPGVSAGWNIHREAFFEPLRKVVGNLKYRVSWGKTGNDNLALKNTEGAYSPGYNYGGQSGILNTTLANKDLLWEETASADMGLDAGFFDNRLNFSGDIYRKKTTNRLVDEKLWPESGFASIKSNFGSLVTKGLEFAIDATPVMTRDFRWDVSFNFSFWRTTIGKLPPNGADKNRTGGGVIYDPVLGKYIETGGFAEGERIGSRFAYRLDGVYATDEAAAEAPYDTQVSATWMGKGKCAGDAIWHDADGNGVIDSRDMVFVGYLHPDKMGAFTNTFQYKNLTLRFVTDFSMGNVIDNKFRSQANANSRNNFATIHDVSSPEMWHEPGDRATIPRYDVESDWDNGKRNHARPNTSTIGFSGGSVNTLYIRKGDYLAFRELSLGYSLRHPWLSAVHIASLELTAAAYNLGYWTAYDGLTPEVTGADAGKYPRPRQFVFSVRVNL